MANDPRDLFASQSDLAERHRRLKADIDVALEEVRRGEVEPFDIESIKQELMRDLDEHGNRRR